MEKILEPDKKIARGGAMTPVTPSVLAITPTLSTAYTVEATAETTFIPEVFAQVYDPTGWSISLR
ncbi:MAG: hypothetical protein GY854_12150 [Deltaproteobacteria bacterium]|nr:hypothetical protein [Deltaproteobacteria bacterium]